MAALAAAVWCDATSVARADGDPLRVAVRVTAAADRDLLGRVRGQTVDLECELDEAETGPLERTLAEQLTTALRLAREHRATLALWFRVAATESGESLIELHVADLSDQRLLSRELRRSGTDARAVSATLESAALAVRAALQGRLVEGRLAAPTFDLAALARGSRGAAGAPPATRAPRAEASREPGPDPGVAAGDAPPPGPRVRLMLGAQLALDGVRRSGDLGIAAGASLEHDALTLGAVGVYGIGSELADATATIGIARHTVALRAGLHGALGAAFAVELALRAGASVLVRETSSVNDAAVEPTDASATWSALLGAEAVFVAAPPALSPLVGTLALGADGIVPTPDIGYARIDGYDRVYALWGIQPRVELAIGATVP